MSKKTKGIKASKLPKAAIQAVSLPSRSEIKVSFKHLDLTHDKFSIQERESAYFLKLLERFKEVCFLTEREIKTSHKDAMRCHSHEWRKTSEPSGFGLKGQLGQCEGWQFQISSNAHGRVHGVFINDVFFVVWLDPEHALYPSEG